MLGPFLPAPDASHGGDGDGSDGEVLPELSAEPSTETVAEAVVLRRAEPWWMGQLEWATVATGAAAVVEAVQRHGRGRGRLNSKGVRRQGRGKGGGFKCKLCQHWEASPPDARHCPSGDACGFAHGVVELRGVPLIGKGSRPDKAKPAKKKKKKKKKKKSKKPLLQQHDGASEVAPAPLLSGLSGAIPDASSLQHAPTPADQNAGGGAGQVETREVAGADAKGPATGTGELAPAAKKLDPTGAIK